MNTVERPALCFTPWFTPFAIPLCLWPAVTAYLQGHDLAVSDTYLGFNDPMNRNSFVILTIGVDKTEVGITAMHKGEYVSFCFNAEDFQDT